MLMVYCFTLVWKLLKSIEFKKHRYSKHYKELKKQCKVEIRECTRKRIDEAVQDGGGACSWLSRLENLLDPDGCSSKDGGVLSEHREAGLTRQQQADDYAQFISRISRDYVPLTVEHFILDSNWMFEVN